MESERRVDGVLLLAQMDSSGGGWQTAQPYGTVAS